MRKYFSHYLFAALLVLLCGPAIGQNIVVSGVNYGNGNIVTESSGTASPGTTCIGLARYIQTTLTSTATWQCVAGTWYQQGLSSGGTVTSVTFGSLAPLFTASNTGTATAPILTHTLSAAAQNSVFAGPATGGAGAPSYQTAPTFSAVNLTNFPTFNQSTTGTAAGLSGSQTANYFYAAPNGAAGTGLWRAIVAADIPTLNQSTTGTAAGLSGSRAANTVYAAPNGSAGTASFRALVAADVPTLNQSTTGSAAGYSGSAHGLSAPLICPGTSGSGSAFVCSTSPSFTPVAGDTILFLADANSTVTATIAVNGTTASPIFLSSTPGYSLHQTGIIAQGMWVQLTLQTGGVWSLMSLPNMVPVEAGGLGTAFNPVVGSIPIAQSYYTYQPETVSGDCSLATTGAMTCNPVSAQAPTYTTCSTTCVVNLATGRSQIILLTGSPSAMTFAGGTAGLYTFAIVQNSTGGYTLTWPSGTRGGGTISSAAGTSAASTVAVQSFMYVPAGAITTAALVAAGPMTFGN